VMGSDLVRSGDLAPVGSRGLTICYDLKTNFEHK